MGFFTNFWLGGHRLELIGQYARLLTYLDWPDTFSNIFQPVFHGIYVRFFSMTHLEKRGE